MNVLREKESRRRMVFESGPFYDLLGYDTADSQVDLRRLADPQNRYAAILHAPLSHTESQRVVATAPSTLSGLRLPFVTLCG
jgi:hypothetical protein